jgi:hypothetical protein
VLDRTPFPPARGTTPRTSAVQRNTRDRSVPPHHTHAGEPGCTAAPGRNRVAVGRRCSAGSTCRPISHQVPAPADPGETSPVLRSTAGLADPGPRHSTPGKALGTAHRVARDPETRRPSE